MNSVKDFEHLNGRHHVAELITLYYFLLFLDVTFMYKFHDTSSELKYR